MMWGIDELIPAFKPGDKVLVTPRANPEYACPGCGRVNGTDEWAARWEAIVGQASSWTRFTCVACGHRGFYSEGLIRVSDGRSISGFSAVPYTWLTLLEPAP